MVNIMERRKDGTKGLHHYDDLRDQYDVWGYHRQGRYHFIHDQRLWPPPEGYPPEEWPAKPGDDPWLRAPEDHPGHLHNQEEWDDPARLEAHKLTGAEKQYNRAVSAYESEMQEKYPDLNYDPFPERPQGIRQKFINFARRMENRYPGEPIEATTTNNRTSTQE